MCLCIVLLVVCLAASLWVGGLDVYYVNNTTLDQSNLTLPVQDFQALHQGEYFEVSAGFAGQLTNYNSIRIYSGYYTGGNLTINVSDYFGSKTHLRVDVWVWGKDAVKTCIHAE